MRPSCLARLEEQESSRFETTPPGMRNGVMTEVDFRLHGLLTEDVCAINGHMEREFEAAIA